MNGNRSWFLIPAAAAVLLALATPVSAAQTVAQPAKPAPTQREVPMTDPVPAGFASWHEVMATQDVLDRAADRITAAATGAASGYAGIAVEPEARQLRLYWKGAVPASVQRVVDTAAVRVTTTAARYSQQELRVELDRMTEAMAAGLAGQRSRVVAVSPMPDGSGLGISVEGSVEEATSLAAVRASHVAVVVEAGGAVPFSRGNDSPPYFGGAQTVNFASNKGCTTGFGVFASGRSMMVSAAHCARNGDSVFDGGIDFMGTAIGVLPTKDIMLIDARSAGVVFNGGPGAGEFTNRVIGASTNHIGDFICNSGALSGTRCNIKIVRMNESFLLSTINGTITVTGEVRAEHQQFLNAAGPGDSGAPVFVVGADPTTVFARGTHTGGDPTNAPATCTGIDNGRRCTWRVWYAEIGTALNLYGAQILTS
jgi:hypothetical protein